MIPRIGQLVGFAEHPAPPVVVAEIYKKDGGNDPRGVGEANRIGGALARQNASGESGDKTIPLPTIPDDELIVVEVDSYVATTKGGKIILELRGAKPSDKLPPYRSYLTDLQLAAKLGVDRRTIRKLMDHFDNPLPHVYIGNTLRFIEADVVEWASKGKTVSARRAWQKLNKVVTPAASIFGIKGGG